MRIIITIIATVHSYVQRFAHCNDSHTDGEKEKPTGFWFAYFRSKWMWKSVARNNLCKCWLINGKHCVALNYFVTFGWHFMWVIAQNCGWPKSRILKRLKKGCGCTEALHSACARTSLALTWLFMSWSSIIHDKNCNVIGSVSAASINLFHASGFYIFLRFLILDCLTFCWVFVNASVFWHNDTGQSNQSQGDFTKIRSTLTTITAKSLTLSTLFL